MRKNLRQREDRRWYWHWDPRFLAHAGQVHAGQAHAGQALVQQARREQAARRIRVPTLLVRGGLSDVVSPQGARELKGLIGHAELLDIPQAGHRVAGERNAVFSDAVRAFLGRERAAGS